uniref:Uncharacterized protein n=1 Tax=Ditylenchus dipsaci TaxID=166011 RepID=A0A915D0W0_9BILA
MMCNTLILKPLFIALVAVGTALTAIAMFTPGWRQYSSSGTEDINVGIITRSCGGASNFTACGDWWDGQPAWMKTLHDLLPALPVLPPTGAVWPGRLFSDRGYCRLRRQKQDQINGGFPSSLNDEGNIGYSFWVGVGAMLVMIMATFVGCVIGGLSTVSNN